MGLCLVPMLCAYDLCRVKGMPAMYVLCLCYVCLGCIGEKGMPNMYVLSLLCVCVLCPYVLCLYSVPICSVPVFCAYMVSAYFLCLCSVPMLCPLLREWRMKVHRWIPADPDRIGFAHIFCEQSCCVWSERIRGHVRFFKNYSGLVWCDGFVSSVLSSGDYCGAKL